MAPPNSVANGGSRSTNRSLGFVANVRKAKHSFLQFFGMTGILLLSFRSLAQKYRLHELEEVTAALKEEQKSLNNRLNHIKQGLLAEAAADTSGHFAARLRRLFGEDK